MKLRRFILQTSTFVLFACFSLSFLSSQAQISTFPYIQDFGSSNCQIPSGYTNTGSDPWDFQNVSEQYMEGNDHTSGSGCFASMDDSGTATDDSCLLTTPVFDLTSIPNAQLKFWWQNSNATTSLPDTNGPRPWSNLNVDISTDSGSTWTRNVWFVEDSQQIGWTEAVVALDSFISTKTRLRFRGLETQTFRSDMSLDDILIYEPQQWDASLSEIISPIGKSCKDSAASIKVEVKNSGMDTITTLVVSYKVDSLTSVSETISVSILPNASHVHTFTQTANLTSVGNHIIEAWTSLALDSITSNDSMTTTIVIAPTISSFPYFEDFENGQQGWEISGTNSTWAFGSPSKNIISGTVSGSKVFVNGGLTGTYSNNETSEVTSPCLDFTNQSSQLSVGLDVWWETEFSWDGAALQYSTDGGSSWSNVGSYGDPDNWYTDNTINSAPGGQQEGWTGTGTAGAGTWLYAKNQLPTTLIGKSNVLFRVAFASDGSVVADGFAFDNFNIFEPAQWDARVGGITNPKEDLCANSSEQVKIVVFNGGTDTITTLPVSYQVGSGTIVNDTINSVILPGDTLSFTFSQPASFTSPGSVNLTSWTSLALDSAFGNDSSSKVITVANTISSFPYLEDFEGGRAGWKESGDNSTWAFGSPSKTVISSASSGDSAFVNGGLTGTYDPFETSEVSSPCFDFSSTNAQYYVQSDVFWEITSIADGAVLQYTNDNGKTWITVGATGDPNNWYNYNFINSNPGGQGEGWTGNGVNGSSTWLTAKHILPLSFVGGGIVKFRFAFASSNNGVSEGFAFDNFNIYKPDPWDAGVSDLLSPNMVSCGDSMATVTVTAFNEGSDTISSLPISFQLNGGTVYTDTISAVIPPSGTYNHTFSQMINVSAVGSHTLKSWTNLALDSNNNNDTLTIGLTTSPSVSSYPYYEDFENGPQGWAVSGYNSTWVLGTPNKTVIQGAASGSNAFVNGGLTGTYENYEVSNVNSPCFDLPNTTNELWLALQIWWEIENTWDGVVLQYSEDSAQTWTNLGAYNDPYNWFNFDSIFSQPGGQGEGWTGNLGTGSNGWVKAKHQLPASLHGKENVVFRVAFAADNVIREEGIAFDNFAIVENSKVSIDSHQVSTCDTLPISLTATSTSWGRYKWTHKGTSITTDTLTADSSSGRYIVQFTDTILGFKSKDTTFIYFYTPPEIQFTFPVDTIFFSDSTTLDPSLPSNLSYTWTPGNDTTSTLLVVGSSYGLGSHLFNLTVVDSNMCSDNDSVTVVVIEDLINGIIESQADNISLYPNPVVDYLIIEADISNFTIQLFNASGQSVLIDESSVGSIKLNMSELTSGVYYVAISSAQEDLVIKKVIKK